MQESNPSTCSTNRRGRSRLSLTACAWIPIAYSGAIPLYPCHFIRALIIRGQKWTALAMTTRWKFPSGLKGLWAHRFSNTVVLSWFNPGKLVRNFIVLLSTLTQKGCWDRVTDCYHPFRQIIDGAEILVVKMQKELLNYRLDRSGHFLMGLSKDSFGLISVDAVTRPWYEYTSLLTVPFLDWQAGSFHWS